MHDPYTGFIKYTGHFFPPLLENAFKNTKILAFLSPSPFSKSLFPGSTLFHPVEGWESPGNELEQQGARVPTKHMHRNKKNNQWGISNCLACVLPKVLFFSPIYFRDKTLKLQLRVVCMYSTLISNKRKIFNKSFEKKYKWNISRYKHFFKWQDSFETMKGNNDQVYACNSFNERSQGAGSSRGDDHWPRI